jgi:hypothetical protein
MRCPSVQKRPTTVAEKKAWIGWDANLLPNNTMSFAFAFPSSTMMAAT